MNDPGFSPGDRIFWSEKLGWWYMVDTTDGTVWEMDIGGYRIPELPADAIELLPEIAGPTVAPGSVILSKADAEWLCGVIHGEGEEADFNRAHKLLEESP